MVMVDDGNVERAEGGDVMAEYMFGVTRRKLSAPVVKRRDRICTEEGGWGYTQINESHGTDHRGRWVGWFTGPNRGEPFDGDLAARVYARVGNHADAPGADLYPVRAPLGAPEGQGLAVPPTANRRNGRNPRRGRK